MSLIVLRQVEPVHVSDYYKLRRARSTKASTCGTCKAAFVQHRSLDNTHCPGCTAARIDRENRAGAARLEADNSILIERFFDYLPSPKILYTCLICGTQHSRTLGGLGKYLCDSVMCYQHRAKLMKDMEITQLSTIYKVSVQHVRFPNKRPTGDSYRESLYFIGFQCNSCGAISERSLSDLRKGITCACKSSNMSMGAKAVKAFLDASAVGYIAEYPLRLEGMQGQFRFDFYMPDHRIAIEYDGRQHFEASSFFGGVDGLHRLQQADAQKQLFAESVGIRVVRVPYDVCDLHQYLKDALTPIFQQADS